MIWWLTFSLVPSYTYMQEEVVEYDGPGTLEVLLVNYCSYFLFFYNTCVIIITVLL